MCMRSSNTLMQGSPGLVLERRWPAEFSSNPNQTLLNQLIKVLLGIFKTSRQVCRGELGVLQDTGPPGPSLTPALMSCDCTLYASAALASGFYENRSF